MSRATHTSIVRWLSQGHTSLREDLLARWVKFFQSLLASSSPEVSTIARIAARDRRTTTGSNNQLIVDLTGLDPRTATPRQVREELRVREPVRTEEEWERNHSVLELLDRRGTLHYLGVVDPGLNVLLDFICTK